MAPRTKVTNKLYNYMYNPPPLYKCTSHTSQNLPAPFIIPPITVYQCDQSVRKVQWDLAFRQAKT